MLMHFSMIVLSSQLVVAVADHPPTFDIARGCKVDSASAFDPNAGMNATIKRCMDDEQKAKDQLETQWSGFVNSDRVMCTTEGAVFLYSSMVAFSSPARSPRACATSPTRV